MTYTPTYNDTSTTACANNKSWLEECWANGVVPVLDCGTLNLRATAETPIKVGCGRLASKGGDGYWMPAGNPDYDGKVSRINQITPGIPAIRVRGAGFRVDDPVWVQGQGSGTAIEVEGRANPATGESRLGGFLFYNWDVCYAALGGYYNGGSFVAGQQHGDNCDVEWYRAFNCNTIFRSDNEQSVNWRFTNGFWQGTAGGDPCPFKVVFGGCLTVDGFVIENSIFDLCAVTNFSPNTCRLTFKNVYVDRFLDSNANFCWLRYDGNPAYVSWSKWSLDIDAFVCTQTRYLEQHTQYKNISGLPQTDWNIKIHHILQT